MQLNNLINPSHASQIEGTHRYSLFHAYQTFRPEYPRIHVY